MTTTSIDQKSRNSASRLGKFLRGRSMEVFICAIFVALALATWISWGLYQALVFGWGAVWGGIVLLVIKNQSDRRKEREHREPPHRFRLTPYGMVVLPDVKVRPEDLDISNMPSPASEEQGRVITLGLLKNVMLDEGAVTAAEDAHAAVLSAAQNNWDDTGFAEPMAEAIAVAFDKAVDEVMQ